MCSEPHAGARPESPPQTQRMWSKAGKDLSPEEIKGCINVLKEGGAVDITTAKRELPHTLILAMLKVGERIVGLGAIKCPRADYAKRIANASHSGFSFDPRMHELGYVAVLKTNRGGQSGRIVDSLLETFEGALWATTFDDRMKSTLKHRRFTRRGKEWTSRNGKHQISLWIREPKYPGIR
jgi:hypothetical protein